MNLEPSKLSKQATQAWSESSRLFGDRKKVDAPKIDFGLSKLPFTKGESEDSRRKEGKAVGSSPSSTERIFGTSAVDRDGGERKPEEKDDAVKSSNEPSVGKTKDVGSIFASFRKMAPETGTSNLWKMPSAMKVGEATSAEEQRNAQAPLITSPKHLASDGTQHEPGTTREPETEHVTTGEEDETNLLHMACKFYQFNRDSQSWLERGLGTFRVNRKRGSRDGNVRMIGRSSGNQKLLINSIVWADMVLEEVSEKRVKISAQNADSQIPQLFLVQANPSLVSNLRSLLEKYIAASSARSRKRKAEKRAWQQRVEGGDEGEEGEETVEEEETANASERKRLQTDFGEGDSPNTSDCGELGTKKVGDLDEKEQGNEEASGSDQGEENTSDVDEAEDKDENSYK